MMRSALHSLPLLAFLPSAFSAAYFDNSINCEMKDTATPPFEVCGVTEGSSPSPGLIEGPDGEITQIYLGGWSNSFYITQGLSEGKFWSPFDDEAEEYDTDIVVNVARDDDDMCTGVTVSGERCNSCEYCGDGKYSADCTNLANGRMVDCEGTQFGSIFFPLEASALPTSSPPPPIEDDTLTVMIQGKSSAGIEACWEVRNGNTNKVGNKIVLGRCAGKDKNTFVLKAKVGPDGNTYYQVSPKLNDKMVVTGVRVSDEKAWVRIEKSTKVAFDETQSFYALDSGMVGMGIQSECSNEKTCLFVTNQGLDINLGDPVMLSTEKRLKHFAKNGDNIMEWTFIPEN